MESILFFALPLEFRCSSAVAVVGLDALVVWDVPLFPLFEGGLSGSILEVGLCFLGDIRGRMTAGALASLVVTGGVLLKFGIAELFDLSTLSLYFETEIFVNTILESMDNKLSERAVSGSMFGGGL